MGPRCLQLKQTGLYRERGGTDECVYKTYCCLRMCLWDEWQRCICQRDTAHDDFECGQMCFGPVEDGRDDQGNGDANKDQKRQSNARDVLREALRWLSVCIVLNYY